ncbi:trypsin-like peptidase domain-containing protein [Patescibacteria group bacterium]
MNDRNYAGLGIRFSAFIVDLFIIIFIIFDLFWYVTNWNDGWDILILFGLIILYNIFFLSTLSSTPGKLMYGLRVVDNSTGYHLKFTQALTRSLSYVLSIIPIGFGFIRIWQDKRHLGWHDQLAGTAVIQEKPKKKLAVGFTIVALIISMFIFASTYSDSTSFYSYLFRSETREIENRTLLNPNLFNQDVDNDNPVDNNTDSFNINKELAAIVSLECPVDGSSQASYGSGVIIDKEGIIITNYHVIEDTEDSYCNVGFTNDISKEPEYLFYADNVFNENGKDYILQSIGLDVAILHIVSAIDGSELPEGFPVISRIGNSDDLNINDNLYLAGYPGFGAETITFTDGIMSGRVGDDYIKTSAKIDAGNSGGATFNEAGELVGIPTLGIPGDDDDLAYILSIDSVKYLFDGILNKLKL